MRRRRAPVRSKAIVPRCVLDSGGLSALCGRSTRARTWLRWIANHDGKIVLPTPVLVETTTGDPGKDAEVNRIVATLERATRALVPADEDTARRAGHLRYRARHDDGIAALVAAAAVADGSPCVVLSSDPDDLEKLLVEQPQIRVVPV
jgi:hypothetical protein